MTLTTESPAILSGQLTAPSIRGLKPAWSADHYHAGCIAHSGTKKSAWNNDKHKLEVELGFVTVKSLTCRLGSRCEDSFNVLGFNDGFSQSHVNAERGPCN